METSTNNTRATPPDDDVLISFLCYHPSHSTAYRRFRYPPIFPHQLLASSWDTACSFTWLWGKHEMVGFYDVVEPRQTPALDSNAGQHRTSPLPRVQHAIPVFRMIQRPGSFTHSPMTALSLMLRISRSTKMRRYAIGTFIHQLRFPSGVSFRFLICFFDLFPGSVSPSPSRSACLFRLHRYDPTSYTGCSSHIPQDRYLCFKYCRSMLSYLSMQNTIYPPPS